MRCDVYVYPPSGLGEAEWNPARESEEVPPGAEDLDRQGQPAAAAALAGTQNNNAACSIISSVEVLSGRAGRLCHTLITMVMQSVVR